MNDQKDNTSFLKKLIEFTGTKYEIEWMDNGKLDELVIIIDNKVRISKEQIVIGLFLPSVQKLWIAQALESFKDEDCEDCNGTHHDFLREAKENPIELIIHVIHALKAIEIRHKMAEWLKENGYD